MRILKNLWRFLLVVWVVVASWKFFLSGGISLMLLFFVWAFRIGKIFKINLAMMEFSKFFHLVRAEVFLTMIFFGFLGIYFLHWEKRIPFIKYRALK